MTQPCLDDGRRLTPCTRGERAGVRCVLPGNLTVELELDVGTWNKAIMAFSRQR
jgi:hypothetical protein